MGAGRDGRATGRRLISVLLIVRSIVVENRSVTIVKRLYVDIANLQTRPAPRTLYTSIAFMRCGPKTLRRSMESLGATTTSKDVLRR